jgi:hypothetical protein
MGWVFLVVTFEKFSVVRTAISMLKILGLNIFKLDEILDLLVRLGPL